jgi:hypothetical protein
VIAGGSTSGGEEKMGMVAAPAEVPTSAAAVNISLTLSEMCIMQVTFPKTTVAAGITTR